jgi:hypothetical protein
MNRFATGTLFILSAAAFLASPSPQYAGEADCGKNSGNVCWSDEACVNLLFYKQCTTKYKYYEGESTELDPGGVV